ncbi:MAG: hypothetical protein AAFU72_04365 [Pseudomonadota bacterium]
MKVIPFDPKRRSQGRREAADALTRAEERIAMLERTLMNTLRENARNWARAERAEALLVEAERQGTLPPLQLPLAEDEPRPSA